MLVNKIRGEEMMEIVCIGWMWALIRAMMVLCVCE